jgi:O-antigen/teichoic acid export membrane protein
MLRSRLFPTDRFSQDVLWNIASLGVAAVFGVGVNYLVGAVYGAAALGLFNQVFALYVVCSQLAVYGVHGSVLAYLPAVPEPEERKAMFMAALGVTAGAALGIGALFVALARPVAQLLDSPGVAIGMCWAAPGLVFFALNKVILAALNGLQRMRAYALFQAGRVVLMAVALGVCAVLGVRPSTLPVILTASELLTALCSIVTVTDQLGPVSRASLSRWARAHLAFGTRGFLSGLFAALSMRSDVLILGAFASDAAVGAYSLAALVADGMSQILIALRTNYSPVLVKLLAERRTEELLQMVRRVRSRIYPLALAAAVVAAIGYALVVPWKGSDPELARSWIYFAIILAGVVAGSGYVPFNQVLLWAHRPGWYTVLMGATVGVGALLSVVLAGSFGAMGTAIGSAVTQVVALVMLRRLARRVLDLAL